VSENGQQPFIPETFHPLPIAVPAEWERRLGYEGDNRFVALWWQRGADDVASTDGRYVRTGAEKSAWWQLWHGLTRQNGSAVLTASGQPAPPMARLALLISRDTLPALLGLGNRTTEAPHRLVLDRQDRVLYLAPSRLMREWLRRANDLDHVAVMPARVPSLPLAEWMSAHGMNDPVDNHEKEIR
jgi:hypothetical protein